MIGVKEYNHLRLLGILIALELASYLQSQIQAGKYILYRDVLGYPPHQEVEARDSLTTNNVWIEVMSSTMC